MEVASSDKNGGLQTPDGQTFKPNSYGTIHLPDQYADYAETAARTGLFVIRGRTWGGIGPGLWGKKG